MYEQISMEVCAVLSANTSHPHATSPPRGGVSPKSKFVINMYGAGTFPCVPQAEYPYRARNRHGTCAPTGARMKKKKVKSQKLFFFVSLSSRMGMSKFGQKHVTDGVALLKIF